MNLENSKKGMQILPNCVATQNAASSIVDRCDGNQLSSLAPQERDVRDMNILLSYNLGPPPNNHSQECTTESLKRKLQRQIQRTAIYHMQQNKIEKVLQANEILKRLKSQQARLLETTMTNTMTMMPALQVMHNEECTRNRSEVSGEILILQSPTITSPNGAFVALDNDNVITTPLLSKLYSEIDSESERNVDASTDPTNFSKSTDVSSKKRSYSTNCTYVSVTASTLPKRPRVRSYTHMYDNHYHLLYYKKNITHRNILLPAFP